MRYIYVFVGKLMGGERVWILIWSIMIVVGKVIGYVVMLVM